MVQASQKTNFIEQRQYIRLQSVLAVEFRIISGGPEALISAWQQGVTCNVSAGGICLETAALSEAVLKRMDPQSAVVETRIRIPFKRSPITSRAKIAWVRKVDDAPTAHYLVGLSFCSIAPGDAKCLVAQARWLSFSSRSIAAAATVLFLVFLISAFYGYRLRMTNEKLVDHLVGLQQEEKRVLGLLDEIGREKETLSRRTRDDAKGLRPKRLLENPYGELLKRETRITRDLTLLRRRKTGMQKDVLEKMHQWLKNHQAPSTGLVLSFEGDVGIVQDWAFTYDQALAANVFLLFHNERDARRILNFFRNQLTDHFEGFANAYDDDSGEIVEHTVHYGPNIWVGIAVLQYAHQTGDDYYLPVARAIAEWLMTVQDKDPGGAGGLKGGPEFPWFSTEHNLDAYAFFGMMFEVTAEQKYQIAQKKVLSWLRTYALIPHAKEDHPPSVDRGRGDATIATGTLAWSLAALGPGKLRALRMNPQEIMDFAEEHCGVNVSFERPSGAVVEVTGFDFAKSAHMPLGGMVSPEWTSQMVVSYQVLSGYFSDKKKIVKADYYARKAQTYLDELNKLIISSPSAKGQGEGCLPYATLENADTGHGWNTPLGTRTCSIAGTAYMIMAVKQFNPLMLKP